MADLPQAKLPEAARRTLCLDLLAAAGAVSISVNDSTGEIRHGCLLTPGAHKNQVASPTASLNYRTLAGNCLGCKAAGGLVWFTAVILGIDDTSAKKWLSRESGVADGAMTQGALISAIKAAFTPPPPQPALPRYSPAALDAYAHPHPYWTDAPAAPGMPGGGRGVVQKTVERHRLGYDPATKRVVVPLFWKGDLVGWQTRAVADGAPGPKYLNTPSFPKKTALFCGARADEFCWVESVMSRLRHAHVMDDLGSTFGSYVSDAQIGAIVGARRLRRVVLWPDNDGPGWDAVDGGSSPKNGLIARLLPHVPVAVVDSPFTGDPADLDTATAATLREYGTVPAVRWKRPQVLLCPWCENTGHTGPCPTSAGGG